LDDQACAEVADAIALAKRSFHADSETFAASANLAIHAVKMFYDTAESKEGVAAFNEKRSRGTSISSHPTPGSGNTLRDEHRRKRSHSID